MFKLLRVFSYKELKIKDKIIYLTFDDGPEPGITEEILTLLQKYNAKATFFCIGNNYEKYPNLIKLILKDGHALGNHTYSHLNGHKVEFNKYIDEVVKTKQLVKSNLFRPPWGSLTVRKCMKIIKDNKIVLWEVDSMDYKKNMDWNTHCLYMINKTKPGSIILFHFCLIHSEGTRQILLKYIDAASKLGYSFSLINL